MNRSRAGFTLIEVLIALAVMVVIATIAWSTLSSTLEARDLLEQQGRIDREARIALGRIARQLEVAYLTANTTAINTYRTVFVGQDDDTTDRLWFATLAHRRTAAGTRQCDQAEITLWTEADPDHPGQLVLLERESHRIDQYPDKGGDILPLARGVSRFDLRYLDPTTDEWRDDWDSTGPETSGRLPRAVEIVLTLLGPDPDDADQTVEHPFVRTVALQMASELKRSLLNSGDRTIGSGGMLGGTLQ